jgi:translocation and assembly module TamB
MHGDFAANGEIGPLWDLAVGGDRTLTGRVHVAASLAGTLADPRPGGVAELSGGAFSDAGSGLKLVNVGLDARLEQDSVDVVRFVASDGSNGALDGSGRFSTERGGASSFHLSLKKFRLLDNDYATALASGDALISRGGDGEVKVAGALSIDRADIASNPPFPTGVTPMDVVEIHRQPGVGGRLQASTARTPAVALDVTLKAARGIMRKGRGLDAELSLDAHVGGTTAAPQLTGSARVVRGVYDLAGKRFQFDTSGAVYLASDPADIRLDLTATREDPTLTAVVHIEGVATRPRIVLSSTPQLPTDEILSQVLFGTSASQLSPTGAAEVASAITSLGCGGGLDVTANLRAFAHLDRLAFGGDTPGAIVSGGKNLTKNVYIELAGGANGPSGSVEWRPQKNLSVISRLAGPGGDSQISVRWRKDY